MKTWAQGNCLISSISRNFRTEQFPLKLISQPRQVYYENFLEALNYRSAVGQCLPYILNVVTIAQSNYNGHKDLHSDAGRKRLSGDDVVSTFSWQTQFKTPVYSFRKGRTLLLI